MPRPDTVDDVRETHRKVLVYDVDAIATAPDLLHHLSTLIEAAKQYDTRFERTREGIAVKLALNPAELETQLKEEQTMWDMWSRRYAAWREVGVLQEYDREPLTKWAKAENLPVPE